MHIESINPATGKLLQRFATLSDEAIQERISRADAAYASQRETPLDHRSLWLRKLASLLEQDADDLAATVAMEIGTPVELARQEALSCASACRFFADRTARVLAAQPVPMIGGQGYLQWEPLGVVFGIMPWNAPLWNAIRFAAPALVAGNACLLKHSPNASRTALALEALIRRSGFPRGSYQTLLIEARQVERILGDPRVAAVTLTGNHLEARAIAAQAGWLGTKAVLTPAGSALFLVQSSAHIESAVTFFLTNNGLSGGDAPRFLIATEVYDTFVARLLVALRSLRVGDPFESTTSIGPMATREQVEKLQAQIQRAAKAGARVLLGGARLADGGNFFQPTILTDIPHSCPVAREDLLGPVAIVYRMSSLEETLAHANDAPAVLSAFAWTRDPAEQQHLLSELSCPLVYLNPVAANSDPSSPLSEPLPVYHRQLSAAAIRDFMTSKTVFIAAPPAASRRRETKQEPRSKS